MARVYAKRPHVFRRPATEPRDRPRLEPRQNLRGATDPDMPTEDALLLEDGVSFLLLEDGGYLLLE